MQMFPVEQIYSGMKDKINKNESIWKRSLNNASPTVPNSQQSPTRRPI